MQTLKKMISLITLMLFQKQYQLTFTLIVWTKNAIKVNVD